MSQIQSWEVSDALWERVAPLVPRPQRDPNKIYKRKAGAGRKPLNPRQVFAGILFVLRTGCQWKALPKERSGSPSSVHAYFRQWSRAGFFLNLWKAGLAEYDELKGIEWSWLSIDGSMIKAPLAQDTVGPNPTDRGKRGTKRHVLVDGRGVPLAVVLTGANRHDVTRVENVMDGIVATRPQSTPENLQHLYADKAYDSAAAQKAMEERGIIPHVRSRGEEKRKKEINGYKAHRWVVEACFSWLNRFRKLFVRYEKTNESYFTLVCLACAIIIGRNVAPIYG